MVLSHMEYLTFSFWVCKVNKFVQCDLLRVRATSKETRQHWILANVSVTQYGQENIPRWSFNLTFVALKQRANK